ncbi:MAG: transporter related [Frankiales bacterium]|nr:transporter related [Frankiales bacterium]
MTAPTLTGALELHHVCAGYGKVAVLHDIDLVVPDHGILALLGPNGAGKSTLLRVATGRTQPTSGRVVLRGKDVTGRSPERLARTGLCSVPEGRAVFPNLSVTDNLRMWTYRPGLNRKDVEEQAFARFPRLKERRRQLAGRLSGGEQQMLAMSRALTANPDLLLLDEISMGLAPVVAAELFGLVRQIADDGTPVLLVEQFARTALEIADSVSVMSQGRIRVTGSPDEVRDRVLETYLHAGASQNPASSPSM